ncbi:MAG: AMP-binding protein [Lachnospiraceae bacterium]|nr:AMP-binding protein [Lachnospiraceae bacterium]
MIIVSHVRGKDITLLLSGRLDTDTAHELREEVEKIPEDVEKLEIDLRNLSYISSAGLRELMVCRKHFPDAEMRIINVQDEVYEVFEMTGFDSLMSVERAIENKANYINLSFKSFLESKVKELPDRVVIKTDNDSYTWRDIDRCSQIAASDLAALGVTKGSHVGIISSNSVNWVITFFAVQKLGAMGMLINPGLFREEVETVANTGDITHLCFGELTSVKDRNAFADEIKASGKCGITEVYDIGRDRDFKGRYDEYEGIRDKFGQTVESDAPALVIFTSGSTGKPKGVILSAYNVLNAAGSSRENQTLTRDDRTCLILPLFHIFGLVAGLFSNFLADSLMCFPKDIRTDTLLDLIEGERCTIFHTVPTMMIALLNNKSFSPERCESLRCTILSGAAATEAQIKMFREKLPNEHFISSYGLSEMAPVSTSDYDDTEDHLLHTVGKTVPNIELSIRNIETGKECRFGEQGEILVQGYNLMTGYYKLSPDDQSIDRDGWLHTGDLGYLTPDGYVVLSGRLKELIIRGGENIMPGEVETAITAFEGIAMVKVFGVPSDFFGEEVGACVLMKEGESFDEEKLRTFLAERLAKFKIPAYFVVYDGFPLLGSGKIDGVKLKADMLKKLGKA